MRRATLTARVALATSGSMLIVMSGYAWALHHGVRGALQEWERSNLAAIGHHVVGMVQPQAPEGRAELVRNLNEQLSGFGVSLALGGSGAPSPESPAVAVPLDEGNESLIVAAREGAADVLGKRLAPLYLGLVGAVFVALLAAVQGSIYWGFTRPMRAVRRQVQMMRRGPWKTTAGDAGGAELVGLALEIERVGETLEERVTQWVEAERRAGAELALHQLRSKALPLARESNLMTSELLAAGGLSADDVRRLRRLQAASDHLTQLYTLPLDEVVSVGLAPRAPNGGDEEESS